VAAASGGSDGRRLTLRAVLVSWRRTCVALVVGHLAIAVARIPLDVIDKRWRRIAEYHDRGAPAFFLDTKELDGKDAVEWILRHVPTDSAVLYRGANSGVIEFVPPLIHPRLLYAESWLPGDGSIPSGWPLARGPIDGRDAVAVLVCEPEQRGRRQRARIEAR